jgi:hypothetical protein
MHSSANLILQYCPDIYMGVGMMTKNLSKDSVQARSEPAISRTSSSAKVKNGGGIIPSLHYMSLEHGC